MKYGYYYSSKSLEWIFGAVFGFIVFTIVLIIKWEKIPLWMIITAYGMLIIITIIFSIFTYIYREITLAKYYLNKDNIEIKYKDKLLKQIYVNKIIKYKEDTNNQSPIIIYYYDEEKNVQEVTFEYRTVLSNYLEIKIPDKKEKNNG